MILTSGFNFPFFTSTLFSMCFAVDIETTLSKRVLSFFALFNLMKEAIKIFGLFLLIVFEYGRLRLSKLHILIFFFSKTRKSINMPISTGKKNTFFKNKRLLLHYKCCTYQNISFFPYFWMKLAGLKTTGRFI